MKARSVAMWASTGDRCGIAAYTTALTEQLERLAIRVDRVPVPYEDRDPGRFADTLHRLNAADLIHIQHEYTFWGGIAPGSSSLRRYYQHLLKPRVVTAHTVFTAAELLRVEQETRWRQRLAKRLLARIPRFRRSVEVEPFSGARALIVHTGEARQRMLERGFPPDQVHLLAAGVPEPPAAPSAEEIARFRARWGMEDGRLLVVFGYVTPDKGYEVVLESLQSLPPPVKLLIAGGARVEREAPYLEVLRREIDRRGLKGRVAITGYLEGPEVALAMGAAELVLVPHLAANGSYSVRVALGCGKPVLASDLACFRDIAELEGGLDLFETGDSRSLSERLGYLLASASARSALAEAARRFSRGQGWPGVAASTTAVYEAALAA